MTRAKKTEGERIAFATYGMLRDQTAAIIDRALRRAKEKAWDECHLWLNDHPDATNASMNAANPYRGKRR